VCGSRKEGAFRQWALNMGREGTRRRVRASGVFGWLPYARMISVRFEGTLSADNTHMAWGHTPSKHGL